MLPGEEPPVPRIKRTEVYAIAKVQKANRTYIMVPSWEIFSRMNSQSCFSFTPSNFSYQYAVGRAAIESDKDTRKVHLSRRNAKNLLP
jgi:hypothetical protein